MPKTIILDCDPGHDDAIAILLAAGSPEVEIAAITTVAGNQTIEKVTNNARVVATLAGLSDVVIAAGCTRPLVREIEIAPSIHGDSGMDGPALPEPTVPLDPRHAVDVIIDTIMSADSGTITLVPTGALTNIALAARKEPRIVERVAEVVLMGGGYQGGNWTPAAEFNILIDPEAAHVVFNEQWPVRMVGIDVTHQALATPDAVEPIAALDTPISRFVMELLEFFGQTNRDEQGFRYPPVHDPCAVAYVIDPDVLTLRPTPVDIELTGTLTLGMTVADLRGPAPADCHTSVATAIDVPRFWALIRSALERLGATT